MPTWRRRWRCSSSATSAPVSSTPTRPSPPRPPAHPHRLGADLHRAGTMLVFAVGTNITINIKFPEMADAFPSSVWRVGGDPADRPGASPRLGGAAGHHQGFGLPAVAGAVRLDDAGGGAARRLVAVGPRPGLVSAVFDNIPLTALAPAPGRMRLGLPGLRGGLWRFDAVVRLVGRGGPVEHVPRGPLWRPSGCATAGTCRWPT